MASASLLVSSPPVEDWDDGDFDIPHDDGPRSATAAFLSRLRTSRFDDDDADAARASSAGDAFDDLDDLPDDAHGSSYTRSGSGSGSGSTSESAGADSASRFSPPPLVGRPSTPLSNTSISLSASPSSCCAARPTPPRFSAPHPLPHPSLAKFALSSKADEDANDEADFDLDPDVKHLQLSPLIARQRSHPSLEQDGLLWGHSPSPAQPVSTVAHQLAPPHTPHKSVMASTSSAAASLHASPSTATSSAASVSAPESDVDLDDDANGEDGLLDGLVLPDGLFDGPVLEGEDDPTIGPATGPGRASGANGMTAAAKLQSLLDRRSKGQLILGSMSGIAGFRDGLSNRPSIGGGPFGGGGRGRGRGGGSGSGGIGAKKGRLSGPLVDEVEDGDVESGLVITDDMDLSPSRLRAKSLIHKVFRPSSSSRPSWMQRNDAQTSTRPAPPPPAASNVKPARLVKTAIAAASQPSRHKNAAANLSSPLASAFVSRSGATASSSSVLAPAGAAAGAAAAAAERQKRLSKKRSLPNFFDVTGSVNGFGGGSGGGVGRGGTGRGASYAASTVASRASMTGGSASHAPTVTSPAALMRTRGAHTPSHTPSSMSVSTTFARPTTMHLDEVVLATFSSRPSSSSSSSSSIPSSSGAQAQRRASSRYQQQQQQQHRPSSPSFSPVIPPARPSTPATSSAAVRLTMPTASSRAKAKPPVVSISLSSPGSSASASGGDGRARAGGRSSSSAGAPSPSAGAGDNDSTIKMSQANAHSRLSGTRSARRKPEGGVGTNAAGGAVQSRRTRRLARKKPTLIRNLSSPSTPKVIGDMTYNPAKQRWEGNEGVLREFNNQLSSSTRPALITQLTGSSTASLSLFSGAGVGVGAGAVAGSSARGESVGGVGPAVGQGGGCGSGSYLAKGIRVVGDMVFDPVRMCWLSRAGEDEPDPFADFADDEDGLSECGAHAGRRGGGGGLAEKRLSGLGLNIGIGSGYLGIGEQSAFGVDGTGADGDEEDAQENEDEERQQATIRARASQGFSDRGGEPRKDPSSLAASSSSQLADEAHRRLRSFSSKCSIGALSVASAASSHLSVATTGLAGDGDDDDAEREWFEEQAAAGTLPEGIDVALWTACVEAEERHRKEMRAWIPRERRRGRKRGRDGRREDEDEGREGDQHGAGTGDGGGGEAEEGEEADAILVEDREHLYELRRLAASLPVADTAPASS